MGQTKQDDRTSYQKITSHPHFPHFILYSLSYILFGQVITSLGPLFPYLAVHQNKLETQYSFLFLTRALGFMIGSILIKFFGTKLTLHQLIGTGVALMSIFSILFNFSQNLQFKGLCIFLSSMGGSFQDIAINMAALESFKGQTLPMWIQTLHGTFGIGGLLGPFVVYIFQLSTLTVLGSIAIFTLIFYYYLQTPQNMKKQNPQTQQQPPIQIPKTSIYLISLCFFFAVGQQVSYGGWISSYAVLYKFSTKQHATFYSSLFWISITFFRFALAFITGAASKKLQVLAIIGVLTSFISLFLIFQINSQFGLIAMSILFGLGSSVMFPLLLTTPQQFGYKLTVSESTTFIICASLGEGCLAVIVGKMMGWFAYNWLIYSILLMNVCIFFVIRINATYMTEYKIEYDKNGKLGKYIDDLDQKFQKAMAKKKNTNINKDKSIQMNLIEK